MTRGAAPLLAGCVIMLGLASPTRGQSALTAGVGEAADAATGVATGTTLSVGLTTYRGPGGLSLGLGVPTDAQAGTRWGTAAGWGDWPALAWGLGLATSATGFAYADPVLETDGAAVAGRAELYRGLDAGPVRLRLRGGGRAGAFRADTATVRRGLWGAGADATLSTATGMVRLTTELWAAPEAVYPAIAASGVFVRGGIVLYARVDRWLHTDLPDTGWSLGAEIPVVGRLALVLQAARPTTDILFSSPPQGSWTVAARYGFGAPPPAAMPAPVVMEAGETVRLEVAVPEHAASAGAATASDAETVRVAGTFSDWEPVAMTRRRDRWVLDLTLAPGVYEYAFVDHAGLWFVPEGTPGRKPDGFGGHVATVVVR